MSRYAGFVILGMCVMLASGPAFAGGAVFDLQDGALDPQACGGSGCWTNYLRVADLDGDDDLDILLVNYPDYFEGADSPEPLVIYTNDGSGGFTNASASALGNHAGNHRGVAVGDVDGDGSRDIFGPDGSGGAYVLFINDGSGVFTDEADVRMPAGPYPQGASAKMGDVDNDGDLDIFSADGYASGGATFGHLYLNDGSGVFEEKAGAIPGAITGNDINDCDFLDVDQDFDLDLWVNAHSGGSGALWLNDGTGMFSAQTTVDPPASNNLHYNSSPCDVDGDGDLDMWVDNVGGGFTEQLLINDGAGNFGDETNARVTGNPGEDDNGVVCVDLESDGDFDGVVISLGTPERLLLNDGAGNFEYVAGAFPSPTDSSLWGEFGDLDGDGRIDFVTGQGESSSSDEVYKANTGLPIDTGAPGIRGVEGVVGPVASDATPIVRFAVTDQTATDEGPRLARAYAVIDPDDTAVEVDATYVGGDLFRVELPSQPGGTVTFTVCAVDPQGNSTCADNQSYDVEGGAVDTTGGADSSGGNTASGDASDSATATSPGTDSATDPGTASATGEGTSGTAGSDDDGGGGCGCDAGAPRTSEWLGLLLLALGLRPRRR